MHRQVLHQVKAGCASCYGDGTQDGTLKQLGCNSQVSPGCTDSSCISSAATSSSTGDLCGGGASTLLSSAERACLSECGALGASSGAAAAALCGVAAVPVATPRRTLNLQIETVRLSEGTAMAALCRSRSAGQTRGESWKQHAKIHWSPDVDGFCSFLMAHPCSDIS